MSTTTPPTSPRRPIRRVAILFAGGPAPAANAVISAAAVSFLRNGVEVVGVLHGYSHLMEFAPDRPLKEGQDYLDVTHPFLRRSRNARGVLLGTARSNPGKLVTRPADLADPKKAAGLKTVHAALTSLGVDALVSIGGDDTLKTANKLKLYQAQLPVGGHRFAVVHVPKTIDNDYYGIDFTFGYFTAVETLAAEVRNLVADAEATQSYYLAEVMGRSAGWLAYGAAIAGEASLVMGVEEVVGEFLGEEPVEDPGPGAPATRPVMNVDRVVDRLVDCMIAREAEEKDYGVIVLAEGMSEYLPARHLEGIPRDDHGHISIARVNFGKLFAELLGDAYGRRCGRSRKVTGVTLGYEARCAPPTAFDVMLGSQLGVGAYRALIEEGHDGAMVSVAGLLNLHYVPFEELVDPETLVTNVRRIEPGSDFQRLARFLETYQNPRAGG